jgi:hypothetical protein
MLSTARMKNALRACLRLLRGAFGLSQADVVPEPFAEVPRDVPLLRFVPVAGGFINPTIPIPTWKAFEPNEGDKKEAEETGRPVAVSVWNRRLTTIAQAHALRGSAKPSLIFTLQVGDVHDVARSSGAIGGRVRVLAMPYIPSIGPGSEGHCGIEGCDRQNVPRPQWRDMLQRLAEKCAPVAE